MARFSSSSWLQINKKASPGLDGDTTPPPPGEPLWTGNFVRVWIINLALCTWGFMLNAPFTFYVLELGGDEFLAGIAAGGFAMSALAIRPFAGWILDHNSRKSLLTWGTIFLIIFSLLLMLVPILAIAILLRILSGVLFSGAGTGCVTNACDTIPQSRFGEGLGFLGLGNSLATALGPAIGLAIIASLGFPHLFAASAAALLLAILMTRGFSFKEVAGGSDTEGQEKIKLSTLFNADALPASVVMLFSGVPYGAISVFIALYGAVYGLGSGVWFFILVAVGTGSTRLVSGRIADKKGEQPMIIAGNGGFLIALLLLLVENSACYYVSGLFFGIGFGVSIPAMQSMAMRIVPMERRGSASSTYQCSYDVSSGIGGVVAGWLVTIWGYHAMFAALCVFIVISMLLYFFWAAKTPSAFKVYMRNRQQG